MSATIEVKGLADLEAKLVQLGAVGGAKALASSGRKVFVPVVDEAKRTAPVGDQGAPHLRDAIGIVVQRKNLPDGLVARVGLRINRAPAKVRRFLRELRKRYGVTLSHAAPRRYWHLVEFGTRRSRPQPFLRRAFDAHVQSMVDGLVVDLRKKVKRAQKKGLIGSEDA